MDVDYKKIFYRGIMLLKKKGKALTKKSLLIIPVYVKYNPFPTHFVVGNNRRIKVLKEENFEKEISKFFEIPENIFIILPPKENPSIWNWIGSKILNNRKNPVILRWL